MQLKKGIFALAKQITVARRYSVPVVGHVFRSDSFLTCVSVYSNGGTVSLSALEHYLSYATPVRSCLVRLG